MERRAVRDAWHSALRGVRALSVATLVAALTLAVHQGTAWASPGFEAWPDLESWWSEPGRPAQSPEGWLGVPFPRTLAGLTRGGWTLESPDRAPEGLPWPGVDAARRPSFWYDSVATGFGGASSWSGPDAALEEIRGLRRSTGQRRARAVFHLASGDFGTDDYGLAFERGDSLRWLRAETSSARRGAVGALGLAGSHVWGVSGGMDRGGHRLHGSYAQRGSAGELRDGLASEAVAGEIGEIGWSYQRGRNGAALRFARGHDHRESFDQSFGTVLPYSRREGGENRATLEAARSTRAGSFGARFECRQSSVWRSDDPAFSVRGNLWWGGLALVRPAGEGRLRLELGGGRLGLVGGSALAPRAVYEFGAVGWEGRLFAARLIVPIGSDLAPGEKAFLQSTWAGGFEIVGRGPRRLSARTSLRVGVTRDRALLVRYPLEDVSLRVGTTADPSRYGFGLADAGFEWRREWLGVGGSGYVLWRDVSRLQPRVDPGAGLLGFAEARTRLFQGDLAVVLRGEVEGVGAREAEFSERRLPEYLTVGASLLLSLADVSVVVRGRNLENRRREEVWLDPFTDPLVEALGPGREFRLQLSWRLFD